MIKYFLVGLTASLMVGCPGFGNRTLDESPSTVVTYESHVKALLANKCLNCHGDPPTNGAPANTDLTTYDQAVSFADRLYDRTVVRQDMPPQIPLNEEEASIIISWIDAGTPRGEISEGPDERGGGGEDARSEPVPITAGTMAEAGTAGQPDAPSEAGAPGTAGSPADDTATTAGQIENGDVDRITWDADIEPIVKQNCAFAGCHGGGSMQGSLNLDTYSGYRNGGANGELTGNDNADESAFVDRLRQRKGLPLMPPNGALPTEQIELIEAWINAGSPEK
ncbi:MAG: c-type cytochrome domain-containing protein [Myxococcota bacterium]|nr:c-type cytochrome domain-containing protein [Myxococcota bacterium]